MTALSYFVKGVLELRCIEDVLLKGPGQRQIYKVRPSVLSGCPSFRMLALRLDFRPELLSSLFAIQVSSFLSPLLFNLLLLIF